MTGDNHTSLYEAEPGSHRGVTAHYHRASSEIDQIVVNEEKNVPVFPSWLIVSDGTRLSM
ncbi:MAG: hypothetical protein M0Q91_08990 [Methanoregula sp.]|nr:hypothetical protein [Methanoregula sp.]